MTSNMSDELFVYLYAKQPYSYHSFHYYPTKFAGGGYFHWSKHFFIILLLLLITHIYFYFLQIRFKPSNKRNNPLLLSSFCILTLVTSVLLQWYFTEINPKKIIAIIGPSRFTMFGYWMIVINWTVMLFYNNWYFKKYFTEQITHYKLKYNILFLIVSLIIFNSINNKKEIYKSMNNKDIDLFKFIKTTSTNSIFLPFYGRLVVDIPIICK